MYKLIIFFVIFSSAYLYEPNCYSPYDLNVGNTYKYEYYPNRCNNVGYYTLGCNLEGHSNVYFKITTYDMAVSVYAEESNYDPLYKNAFVFINRVDRYAVYSKSYNFSKEYKYVYFYIAPAYNEYFVFDVRADFTTTLAVFIIILIVVGGLICLALIAMAIAKGMGKSPWEGLAWFCIICTICCVCKR